MWYEYAFLVALCLVSLGVFLILRTKQATVTSLLAKTFASIVFVVLGAVSIIKAGHAQTKMLFVLGLVAGLIGDIVLDLKVMHPENGKTYFNFGTLMFGMGHIMYFFGILIYISDKVVTGFGWAALSAFVFSALLGFLMIKYGKALKLDFTGYGWQCGIYGGLLIFMMLISICISLVLPICWIMAAGFTLFLASDLVLSQQYFGGKLTSKPLIVVNHVLYYVAQLLLASFIFFI